MRSIMFSKMLKEKTPEQLADLAEGWGLGGYDLCVRPDYAVNPDNASEVLPGVVADFRARGLDIPMVTGNFDLLEPDHPTAEPILQAMDKADVRLLKLGYFKFTPGEHDYLAEVKRIRAIFERWCPLAEKYGVKICYHTHSNKCMGLNGAAMVHLLDGFDPALIGAYMDPAHLLAEGEDFATAIAMIKPWLSIIAVKDVNLIRVEKDGHGSIKRDWVMGGTGCVDWTNVFDVLNKVGYDGPVSIHCEFKVPEEEFLGAVEREIGFFNRFIG
ncbi:MAG: sugar phosphate isomerase/epimerase [Victivallales bacterium]|jgi:sugar phosphate isomerase/epimerase|nr:sugar phosphate isomerase/epimerase [Victivallales bacterium]